MSRPLHRADQAAAYFAANTRHCTKTKLMRLLYLLDFHHLLETGRSVTDEVYIAMPDGPVPAALHTALHSPAESPFAAYLEYDPSKDSGLVAARVPFDDADFTPRQLRLMADLCERFGDDPGARLGTAVRDPLGPWHATRKQATSPCPVIAPERAFDNSPNRGALLALFEEHQACRAAA